MQLYVRYYVQRKQARWYGATEEVCCTHAMQLAVQHNIHITAEADENAPLLCCICYDNPKTTPDQLHQIKDETRLDTE